MVLMVDINESVHNDADMTRLAMRIIAISTKETLMITVVMINKITNMLLILVIIMKTVILIMMTLVILVIMIIVT